MNDFDKNAYGVLNQAGYEPIKAASVSLNANHQDPRTILAAEAYMRDATSQSNYYNSLLDEENRLAETLTPQVNNNRSFGEKAANFTAGVGDALISTLAGAGYLLTGYDGALEAGDYVSNGLGNWLGSNDFNDLVTKNNANDARITTNKILNREDTLSDSFSRGIQDALDNPSYVLGNVAGSLAGGGLLGKGAGVAGKVAARAAKTGANSTVITALERAGNIVGLAGGGAYDAASDINSVDLSTVINNLTPEDYQKVGEYTIQGYTREEAISKVANEKKDSAARLGGALSGLASVAANTLSVPKPLQVFNPIEGTLLGHLAKEVTEETAETAGNTLAGNYFKQNLDPNAKLTDNLGYNLGQAVAGTGMTVGAIHAPKSVATTVANPFINAYNKRKEQQQQQETTADTTTTTQSPSGSEELNGNVDDAGLYTDTASNVTDVSPDVSVTPDTTPETFNNNIDKLLQDDNEVTKLNRTFANLNKFNEAIKTGSATGYNTDKSTLNKLQADLNYLDSLNWGETSSDSISNPENKAKFNELFNNYSNTVKNVDVLRNYLNTYGNKEDFDADTTIATPDESLIDETTGELSTDGQRLVSEMKDFINDGDSSSALAKLGVGLDKHSHTYSDAIGMKVPEINFTGSQKDTTTLTNQAINELQNGNLNQSSVIRDLANYNNAVGKLINSDAKLTDKQRETSRNLINSTPSAGSTPKNTLPTDRGINSIVQSAVSAYNSAINNYNSPDKDNTVINTANENLLHSMANLKALAADLRRNLATAQDVFANGGTKVASGVYAKVVESDDPNLIRYSLEENPKSKVAAYSNESTEPVGGGDDNAPVTVVNKPFIDHIQKEIDAVETALGAVSNMHRNVNNIGKRLGIKLTELQVADLANTDLNTNTSNVVPVADATQITKSIRKKLNKSDKTTVNKIADSISKSASVIKPTVTRIKPKTSRVVAKNKPENNSIGKKFVTNLEHNNTTKVSFKPSERIPKTTMRNALNDSDKLSMHSLDKFSYEYTDPETNKKVSIDLNLKSPVTFTKLPVNVRGKVRHFVTHIANNINVKLTIGMQEHIESMAKNSYRIKLNHNSTQATIQLKRTQDGAEVIQQVVYDLTGNNPKFVSEHFYALNNTNEATYNNLKNKYAIENDKGRDSKFNEYFTTYHEAIESTSQEFADLFDEAKAKAEGDDLNTAYDVKLDSEAFSQFQLPDSYASSQSLGELLDNIFVKANNQSKPDEYHEAHALMKRLSDWMRKHPNKFTTAITYSGYEINALNLKQWTNTLYKKDYIRLNEFIQNSTDDLNTSDQLNNLYQATVGHLITRSQIDLINSEYYDVTNNYEIKSPLDSLNYLGNITQATLNMYNEAVDNLSNSTVKPDSITLSQEGAKYLLVNFVNGKGKMKDVYPNVHNLVIVNLASIGALGRIARAPSALESNSLDDSDSTAKQDSLAFSLDSETIQKLTGSHEMASAFNALVSDIANLDYLSKQFVAYSKKDGTNNLVSGMQSLVANSVIRFLNDSSKDFNVYNAPRVIDKNYRSLTSSRVHLIDGFKPVEKITAKSLGIKDVPDADEYKQVVVNSYVMVPNSEESFDKLTNFADLAELTRPSANNVDANKLTPKYHDGKVENFKTDTYVQGTPSKLNKAGRATNENNIKRSYIADKNKKAVMKVMLNYPEKLASIIGIPTVSQSDLSEGGRNVEYLTSLASKADGFKREVNELVKFFNSGKEYVSYPSSITVSGRENVAQGSPNTSKLARIVLIPKGTDTLFDGKNPDHIETLALQVHQGFGGKINKDTGLRMEDLKQNLETYLSDLTNNPELSKAVQTLVDPKIEPEVVDSVGLIMDHFVNNYGADRNHLTLSTIMNLIPLVQKGAYNKQGFTGIKVPLASYFENDAANAGAHASGFLYSTKMTENLVKGLKGTGASLADADVITGKEVDTYTAAGIKAAELANTNHYRKLAQLDKDKQEGFHTLFQNLVASLRAQGIMDALGYISRSFSKTATTAVNYGAGNQSVSDAVTNKHLAPLFKVADTFAQLARELTNTPVDDYAKAVNKVIGVKDANPALKAILDASVNEKGSTETIATLATLFSYDPDTKAGAEAKKRLKNLVDSLPKGHFITLLTSALTTKNGFNNDTVLSQEEVIRFLSTTTLGDLLQGASLKSDYVRVATQLPANDVKYSLTTAFNSFKTASLKKPSEISEGDKKTLEEFDSYTFSLPDEQSFTGKLLKDFINEKHINLESQDVDDKLADEFSKYLSDKGVTTTLKLREVSEATQIDPKLLPKLLESSEAFSKHGSYESRTIYDWLKNTVADLYFNVFPVAAGQVAGTIAEDSVNNELGNTGYLKSAINTVANSVSERTNVLTSALAKSLTSDLKVASEAGSYLPANVSIKISINDFYDLLGKKLNTEQLRNYIKKRFNIPYVSDDSVTIFQNTAETLVEYLQRNPATNRGAYSAAEATTASISTEVDGQKITFTSPANSANKEIVDIGVASGVLITINGSDVSVVDAFNLGEVVDNPLQVTSIFDGLNYFDKTMSALRQASEKMNEAMAESMLTNDASIIATRGVELLTKQDNDEKLNAAVFRALFGNETNTFNKPIIKILSLARSVTGIPLANSDLLVNKSDNKYDFKQFKRKLVDTPEFTEIEAELEKPNQSSIDNKLTNTNLTNPVAITSRPEFIKGLKRNSFNNFVLRLAMVFNGFTENNFTNVGPYEEDITKRGGFRKDSELNNDFSNIEPEKMPYYLTNYFNNYLVPNLKKVLKAKGITEDNFFDKKYEEYLRKLVTLKDKSARNGLLTQAKADDIALDLASYLKMEGDEIAKLYSKPISNKSASLDMNNAVDKETLFNTIKDAFKVTKGSLDFKNKVSDIDPNSIKAFKGASLKLLEDVLRDLQASKHELNVNIGNVEDLANIAIKSGVIEANSYEEFKNLLNEKEGLYYNNSIYVVAKDYNNLTDHEASVLLHEIYHSAFNDVLAKYESGDLDNNLRPKVELLLDTLRNSYKVLKDVNSDSLDFKYVMNNLANFESNPLRLNQELLAELLNENSVLSRELSKVDASKLAYIPKDELAKQTLGEAVQKYVGKLLNFIERFVKISNIPKFINFRKKFTNAAFDYRNNSYSLNVATQSLALSLLDDKAFTEALGNINSNATPSGSYQQLKAQATFNNTNTHYTRVNNVLSKLNNAIENSKLAADYRKAVRLKTVEGFLHSLNRESGKTYTVNEQELFTKIALLASANAFDPKQRLALSQSYDEIINKLDPEEFGDVLNVLSREWNFPYKGNTVPIPNYALLAGLVMIDQNLNRAVSLIKTVKTDKLNLLSPDFFNNLLNKFNGVTKYRNAKDMGSYIQAVLSATKVAEVNRLAKFGELLEKANPVAYADTKLSNLVIQGIDKLADSTDIATIKTARDLIKGNELTKDSLLINTFTFFKDKPTLGNLVKDFIGRTKTTDLIYSELKNSKSVVQRVREELRNSVILNLKSSLKNLTEKDWATVNKVVPKIDTEGLTFDEFKDIILSGSKQSYLADLLNTVPSVKDRMRIERDINNLAEFTISNRILNGELKRNALAIAYTNLKGKESLESFTKTHKDTINMINRAIAENIIERLQLTNGINLHELRTKINNPEGIEMLRMTYEARKATLQELSKSYSPLARLNSFYGSVYANKSGSNAVILDSILNKDKLASLGYIQLNKANSSGSLAYFVRDFSDNAKFLQGAVQVVSPNLSGINASNLRANHPAIVSVSDPLFRSQMDSLVPVYDVDGSVLRYDGLLDKATQDNYNEFSNDFVENLASNIARLAEMQEAKKFNNSIAITLTNMYRESTKLNPTLTEDYFINIVESRDPIIRRVVQFLPTEFKNSMKELTGRDNFIPIRRDLVNDVIGEHAASVGDLFTGNTRRNMLTNTKYRNYATNILGPNAYRKLIKTEQAVQDTVSTLKENIVVKTVSVVMDNVLSSASQLILRGVPITRLALHSGEKVKEINTYCNLSKKIADIDVKLTTIDPSTDSVRYNKLQGLKTNYKQVISSLTIAPLLKRGEFSSVEGAMSYNDILTLSTDSTNLIDKAIDKVDNKTLREILKYGFIHRQTPIYQTILKVTQYSDFIAKSIYYDHLIAKGVNSQDALRLASDEFVDYDRQQGRTRQYLESIGLVSFTNYLIRGTKVGLDLLFKNPLRTLMYSVGVDPLQLSSVGDPLNDTLLGKLASGRGLSNMGIGLNTGSVSQFI